MSGPKVSAAELKRMKKTEEEKRRLFQSLIREKEKRKRTIEDISGLLILAASIPDNPSIRKEEEKLSKMKREAADSLAGINAALQSRTNGNMAEMLQSIMEKHCRDAEILSEASDFIHETRKTYMEQKMKAFAENARKEGATGKNRADSSGRADTEESGNGSSPEDFSKAMIRLAAQEAERLKALIKQLLQRAEDANLMAEEGKDIPEEIEEILSDEGRDGFSVFNDLHRLDLYRIRPLQKAVEKREKELDDLDERLSAELAVYHSLCREAGRVPRKFAFEESSVEEIRYECGKMIAERDGEYEVRALMRNVRESLTECGYVYLGKKEEEMSFVREIYRFDENAVLHVIYDSQGRVTMEVAVMDQTDREPHPRETETILKEQEKFCDAYEGIFERINEKGVSLRKEMMCPCSPELVQVINTSGFEKEDGEDGLSFAEMYGDRRSKYLYMPS